jgi:DNA-binding beta-propeller fold protein YncE/tRNA A-37 threonylcarbamoyl transferase component Bud32
MITDPRIGTEMAGYRIESVLGRGGMSVVYLAEHIGLKRKAALKLLTPELAVDERFRERFVRESQMAAALDHPNIIPIYEAGEIDGVLYIAMRFVRGTDLRTVLGHEGALQPERAFAICTQAAAALDAAHAEGLVHRDVKPANILLAPGPRPDAPEHVYLSDFGVTKRTSSRTGLTGTGQFVGTLDYAAPEQIEGRPLDARTDVYSLGCVLYECLTGEVPFPRDAEMAVLWAHMSQPPPTVTERQPDLSPAIDEVVARAMAKAPDDRFAACGELADAAQEALTLGPPATFTRGPVATLGPRGGATGAGEAGPIEAPLDFPPAPPGPAGPEEPPSRESPRPPRRPALGRNRLVAVGAIVVIGLVLVVVPLVTRGKDPSALGRSPAPSGAVAATQGLLARIDPLTNEVSGKVFAGTGPMRVAVGEGSAWVADRSSGVVTRFDTEGQKVAAITVAKGLTDIAVGLGRVWVANRDDGNLYLIDPDTNEVRDRIAVGIGIENIALGSDAVWVANNRDGILSKIDPQRKVVADTILGSSTAKFDPAVQGETVWLAAWRQEGTGVVVDLLSVDAATSEPHVRANLVNSSSGQASPPSTIALAAGAAWITTALDNKVRRVDLRTFLERDIPTGKEPIDIISDGSGFVWVANRNDRSVWKISTDTGQAVTTIPLPGTPTSIAAGEGAVWVTLFPREASA